jgi:hypothetical protein
MKYLQQIIRRFFMKDQVVHLGRWNIVYCNKLLDRKIDLSNEDHCGPCGQYLQESNKNIIPYTNKTSIVLYTKNNTPTFYK